MVFYKMDEASLMKMEVNPIETLTSSVTYSLHFDIACPRKVFASPMLHKKQ
jgi:hypothetical protein